MLNVKPFRRNVAPPPLRSSTGDVALRRSSTGDKRPRSEPVVEATTPTSLASTSVCGYVGNSSQYLFLVCV